MDTITGTVERVTYYNDESSYGVVKITPDKRVTGAQARDGTVTIVGTMPELGPGETVQISGTWVDDPKFGRQMRVETITPILPTSLDGIRRYLGSGIVKGIGESTAAKIVDHFGVATLDILNRNPERLGEVKGLKTGLAAKLIQAWTDNVASRQTMIFLQQYGITARMASRIYGEYGSDTIATVQKNPYELADDVFGIGFLRADAIARKMGMAEDATERIRAGLAYALNKLASDGHTCAPRHLLISTVCELLEIDTENNNSPDDGSSISPVRARISAVLDAQIIGANLISDEVEISGEPLTVIYLPLYHTAETYATKRLRRMVNTPSQITGDMAETEWAAYLQKLAAKNSVNLTDQQQSAVKAALTSKVSILTGGPGTGKTTTLQMVISALVQEQYTFALASPTGRAAKRLSEATGYDAFTIHRLLGYSPSEGFAHDEDYPLKVDMLIIDEASMIDLMLFYQVLKALTAETHLMLVGDVDQLPSVGAGNVLRDVIDSGVAHVTRLDTIFRQGKDSHIILNAHRINHGEAPFMDNQSEDFYFFGADDPERAGQLIVDIVQNRLPQRFGFEPLNEVQVIAPMYRGSAGVNALNQSLQAALNGDKRNAERTVNGRTLRVGDKVMQTRNNYDKEVFNGDIGRIHGINFEDNTIETIIDGRFVDYDFTEADELIHAYCISTHRSQGSEYPVVVMPLLTQHYMMLQRNLLYTAITRAKKMVVLVGDRRAIHMAVKNNKVAERYSGLLPRLRDL